ncbi:hypothetical protein [Cysteiniphilum sp. 6C5]|uniref:hypothetical protein n=1 Tax=unclassified Cysteiniphilum TaxID=2610889 RepID=UPI003F876D2E
MKKNLFYFPLLFVFSVNAFGSFNIDPTSVKLLNLTDSILITDYAKEFADTNKVPYEEISDIYNKIISNDTSGLTFFKKSEKISVGQKKYKNMDINITIENKRNIIKSVSIDYDE